ncbi:MAG: large-conductance mechanosensitive channel protein MscL [Alistipes sp.]|nr:large-conductance mechanosensitive channel protein MscL [Alistipes sp.]
MGFLQEFKAFALKGNVMDMAVGVIIGGAFGKIVTSLVNDVIMPPIGLLVGGVDFTDLKLTLKQAVIEAGTEVTPAVTWNYGAFIQQVVDFTILAFCVFMMVKIMNQLIKKREEAPAPAPEPEPSAEEKLLTEIRDLLKERQ